MTAEDRISALGLTLPSPPVPVGNYLPACQVGNLVFTSGQTARINGVRFYVGKVGKQITPDEAYLSARDAALNCLAAIKSLIGSLDRINRIVKVLGFVNCIDEYESQPAAINGASDLLEKIFEGAGKHARSAVGVNSLPSNVSVELEMIVEIK
jgi:enamine deaminase RidA (YjgF/YER057c/UK114 family)